MHDTIVSRQLHMEPFHYEPQFKMILVCNKLPDIPNIYKRIRPSKIEHQESQESQESPKSQGFQIPAPKQ